LSNTVMFVFSCRFLVAFEADKQRRRANIRDESRRVRPQPFIRHSRRPTRVGSCGVWARELLGAYGILASNREFRTKSDQPSGDQVTPLIILPRSDFFRSLGDLFRRSDEI
jgi:hypothetical protein